jgi:succinate dehydrogenase / fumarate reductase, membrane anchor subunit
MMLRESQIMKVHYVTAIAALFVVSVHIIMRVIMPFTMSLTYGNVVANYHNIPYAILLELILVLIAIHGFNGLRIILLEYRQGKTWDGIVNIFSIIAMMAVITYGTRTIIVANGLGFG